MDFLWLCFAILNNSGSAYKAMFTTHPTPLLDGPVFVDNSFVNSVTLYYSYCLLACVLSNQLACQNIDRVNQLTVDRVTQFPTARYKYTREQLTSVNKQCPRSVPSEVIKQLSTLGI